MEALPEAAIAPILIFIGIEITAHAFEATPAQHYRAVALAFLPVVAYLVQIQYGQILGGLGKSAAELTGDAARAYRATELFGNGFIVTALLWGGGFAALLDHRLVRAALFMAICSAASLCGIIHSTAAGGALFSPLSPPDPATGHIAAGYAAMAVIFLLLVKAKPANGS